MNEIAPTLPAEEYEKNFEEMHKPFTPNQATAEANRCLYCFDSPCMNACPTHIDIPTFIKKIATGNVKGSAKTILASNWIALTCAKACPVDVLCEGACVYTVRGERPIKIGRLQRYAIDWYFAHGMPKLFTPAPRNGKSVGVIGGGPSGLACAAELALLGYDVTVYEGRDVAGGLDTWGIAPYKMTYHDSLKEIELVRSLGVTIRTGVWIGREEEEGTGESIAGLEQKHDALFIGIGLARPTALGIPGEELAGVRDALEFIGTVTPRTWNKVAVGRRVAVIGAGNTAIDAATEARRLGAETVTIIYRRGEKDMSAYPFEYELAKRDGISFHFLTAPSRILGNASVEAIECVKMKPAAAASSPGGAAAAATGKKGRPALEPVPGSAFRIPADMVIKAIGQNVDEHFLCRLPGVEFRNGRAVVDPETLQTANPKYFAGGDCINGGKEVVNAAADGKKAAHGIDKYLFNR